MQRQRDAALKDSRARFTTQKSTLGTIKRRFRWTSPTFEDLPQNPGTAPTS